MSAAQSPRLRSGLSWSRKGGGGRCRSREVLPLQRWRDAKGDTLCLPWPQAIGIRRRGRAEEMKSHQIRRGRRALVSSSRCGIMRPWHSGLCGTGSDSSSERVRYDFPSEGGSRAAGGAKELRLCLGPARPPPPPPLVADPRHCLGGIYGVLLTGYVRSTLPA